MKSRGIFATLMCAVLFLASGLQTYAIDVAAGVTEVNIPITVTSAETTPITGIDVWFKCSADLKPIEVVLTSNLAVSEIEYDEDDGTYSFGVFEPQGENTISLSNNNISIFSIKCTFTGSGTSALSLADVIIYRMNERMNFVTERLEGSALPPPISVNRTDAAAANQNPADSSSTVSSPGSVTTDITGSVTTDINGSGTVQDSSSGSAATSAPTDVSPDFAASSNGPIVSAEGKMTFNDIIDAEWAREAIEYLATYKGILGTGYGLFTPNANVTRAQFARFLGQAFDLKGTSTKTSFEDVTITDWYYSDVMKLVSLDIIKGYDGTHFGPNDLISREQMATMVDRTLEYFGFSLSAFGMVTMSDIYTTADYSRLSVQRLYEAGLINGMGDNAFYPRSYTTRGQSAAVIYKALTFAGKG
ncbi:hypothetical protein FACS1894127_0970 [Clostridia bacterium]|nr:hypothetical protein FACS1894127_0970 [Clostridia bacterium]